MVELGENDVVAFIELALDRMMAKASALGPQVSDRPHLEGSNSVFSLVVHCVGVADWWLDHVIMGRPSARDRDAEFLASGGLADLESLVAEFVSRLPDLAAEAALEPQPRSTYLEPATAPIRTWPWTTASIILHVIEELFQHAGHVDVTADLLALEK